MTLDRVIVDLHNSFERVGHLLKNAAQFYSLLLQEMVYVALSRARNLRGLKVTRLARNMGHGVNKEVQDFLRQHLGARANAIDPPRKRLGMRDPWKEWRLAVAKAFADYSAIQRFPAPPAKACDKVECKTRPRLLKACPCSIRAAFARRKLQRMERSRWHPDEFARCPQENRELFQRMAAEVFAVLAEMHQEDRKKRGL